MQRKSSGRCFISFLNIERHFRLILMNRAGTLLLVATLSISTLQALPSLPTFSAPVASARSNLPQVGKRVGLVAAYSGDWVLESAKQKRPVKRRGVSVYENERPVRVSKEGSLTVVCVNNTTAVCPGNHKIGEPFLLNDVEQVDDWWSQFLPFISNYGGWIFPASRDVNGSVALTDAVVCLPAGAGSSASASFDFGDVMARLPDGKYQVSLTEFVDGKEVDASSVKFKLEKSGASAIADPLTATKVRSVSPGLFTCRILAGPSASNVDWSALGVAIVEVATAANYEVHRANLQILLKKIEAWSDSKASTRTDLVRAFLLAQTKAPGSDYPKISKPNRKK